MEIDYSKIKIFIINGYPRSGKDTFCEFIDKNYHKPTFTLSTVDWIKKVAAHCGWDGEKDLRGRKLLSDLKDILTEYDDLPFKKICKDIDVICHDFFDMGYEEEELTFFIMCREPKEIQKLKEFFNAKTILVDRPQCAEDSKSNHADMLVNDYEYDIIVKNETTLENLELAAKIFIEKWII